MARAIHRPRNLIADPRCAAKRADLHELLVDLTGSDGAVPDTMPIDEEIGTALPDARIR